MKAMSVVEAHFGMFPQLPKRTACLHRPHLARTPHHQMAMVPVRRCPRLRFPRTHTPTTTTKALNVRQFPITWYQQDSS